MKKIEVYSNWCYYDQLDGRNLEDGEHLLVHWPDGQIHQITVKIDKHSSRVMDHGGPTDIPIRKAYCETKVYGVPVRVYLAGLPATRVTPMDICPDCNGSGVIDSGNNDFPCHCPAGSKAVFNVAGRGQVRGSVLKQEQEDRLNAPLPDYLK